MRLFLGLEELNPANCEDLKKVRYSQVVINPPSQGA
jgi:hypothetical protein